MILSAVYDKSGVVIGSTSVSYYKVLLTLLVGLWLVDKLVARVRVPTIANRGLYRWLVAFIALQTLASLLGESVSTLPTAFASELYYFVQRANFLLIPLLGMHYHVAPGKVLRLLLAGVVIHLAAVAFQLAWPTAYTELFAAVSDGVREDHTLGWPGGSLDFIGLQRSSNYGGFAGTFGLLALAAAPRGMIRKAARLATAGAAIGVALLGPSRAALIMMLVALVVWIQRRGWLSRASTYGKTALAGAAAGTLIATGALSTTASRSFSAFSDPMREASTLGKLAIAEMGFELFRESPLVGYGARRFAVLTLPLGNTSSFMSEAHSFGLSTLLMSGLVGLTAYAGVWLAIMRGLLRSRSRDYAIVSGVFAGLGFYSVVYDAGGLDLFACFNGLAAYYALMAAKRSPSAPSVRTPALRLAE